MTTEQSRLFADYILGMPDQDAAAEYVRFSAFRLDGTFFNEMHSMIGEARNRNDIQRERSLERLMSVASDACGRAHAPFAEARAARTSKKTKIVKAEPQTDYARAMEMIQLDKRVTGMMMRTHFNPVDDSVIDDWKIIADGYRKLIDAGPPETPLYTIASLRLKYAQALESIGRAYKSMNDSKQSRAYYKQAAKAFEEAGDRAEAANCRAKIGSDRMSEEGEFDGQIGAALQDLEAFVQREPEYFSRLVDLGELQAQAGDDFAAEKTLVKAESGLKAAEWGNPSGSDLAEALVASLKSIETGSTLPAEKNIQTNMMVRTLHRRIHLALADIYRRLGRKGDAAKAAQRLKLAEEMDRSAPDDDFSTTMLHGLAGEWQSLFK
jgi:tetratricopeptide (TPR) repeat protein